MTKASAGLVLDEKRLKELMAGGGLQVSSQASRTAGESLLCGLLQRAGLVSVFADCKCCCGCVAVKTCLHTTASQRMQFSARHCFRVLVGLGSGLNVQQATKAPVPVVAGVLCIYLLQDAGLLGGVLACFGQLFTATIAPGWPSSQQDGGSLLAASMEMGGSSGSSGVTAEYAAAAAAVPQAIVTVRNNEVTRVKAALEAASFESAVSPRIAVRLLHMLVLATAHKFGSGSSKRLEVIHKVCVYVLVCFDTWTKHRRQQARQAR